jgi:hypothetical protein
LRLCNLCHSQSEVAVDQNDFSTCHDLVSDNQVNRIVDVAIKLNYVSGPKVEDFTEGHLACSKSKRGLKLDIQQQFEARG